MTRANRLLSSEPGRPKTRLEILAHGFVRLDSDACLATSGDEYLRPICYDPMPRSFMTLDEAMVRTKLYKMARYTATDASEDTLRRSSRRIDIDSKPHYEPGQERYRRTTTSAAR